MPVVSLRQHKAHLMELASHHHCLVLQSKGLHAFQQYLHQRKQGACHNQLAREFQARARLQQCWAKWLQRCEHNEEIALGGLTRRARAHAARKLTNAVLVAWGEYVSRQRHKKRLMAKADTHFRQGALPK